MKRPYTNPYKYATILLVPLIVVLMIIRGYHINYSWIYYILAISIILYCGWKITVLCHDYDGKRGFVLYFILYTFIASVLLGPILFLVIPHYADKYLFANIVEIKNNDKRYMRTLIWNSPVDGAKLHSSNDYIYNNSADTVYLVSAMYVSSKSILANGDGGVNVQRTLYPQDLIKKEFNIYSYFEELPDTISERGRNLDLSPHPYYFVLSKDQYYKELHYQESYYQHDAANEDDNLNSEYTNYWPYTGI